MTLMIKRKLNGLLISGALSTYISDCFLFSVFAVCSDDSDE